MAIYTQPNCGIATIDGDLYGITIPTLRMVDDIVRERADFVLQWLNSTDSIFLYCLEQSELLPSLSNISTTVWSVSTKQTGILFSGEKHNELFPGQLILNDPDALEQLRFGVVPVLVPLDKNGAPCDINQYQDGELITFAGWEKEKSLQLTQGNGYTPCYELTRGVLVQFRDTPDERKYQLHWMSWHGLLVCTDILFCASPAAAITSGCVCDFVPPKY